MKSVHRRFATSAVLLLIAVLNSREPIFVSFHRIFYTFLEEIQNNPCNAAFEEEAIFVPALLHCVRAVRGGFFFDPWPITVVGARCLHDNNYARAVGRSGRDGRCRHSRGRSAKGTRHPGKQRALPGVY